MFGRGSDGHGCVLYGKRLAKVWLEEFGGRGKALRTGCRDAFGTHRLTANGVGSLWREVGEPWSDVGRCGDKVFVLALFAEFGEGYDSTFRAGGKNAGSTHKFAADL